MASAPLAASRCLAELLRHVVGIDCRVKFRIVLRLFDRDRISLRSRFQTYLHRFFSHGRLSISGPEFGTVRNLLMNGQSGLFTFDHVLVEVNGSVVEVEEQVSIESLPPAVLHGLQERAGTGKIGKVEKLTKKDKLVAYEAKVLSNGKHSEVQVGPDGKPLDHEE